MSRQELESLTLSVMEKHEEFEEESSTSQRMTLLSPFRAVLKSGRAVASWGRAKVKRRKQPESDLLSDEQEPHPSQGAFQSRWVPFKFTV